MIVTLAEVKNYLRVDSDYTAEDSEISDLIVAAERKCASVARNELWMGDPCAKVAVLHYIAVHYENRETVDERTLELELRAILSAGREARF